MWDATRECLSLSSAINIEEALNQFRAYYRANFAFKSRLFDGIGDVLDHYSSWPMVVLSNKSEAFARPLLEKLGVAHHFSDIHGAEAFKKQKPDPLPLRSICKKFGFSPERTVIIGDTPNDILCANHAGTKSCGALYGYSEKNRLIECNPSWTVNSARELIGLFSSRQT